MKRKYSDEMWTLENVRTTETDLIEIKETD